MGKHRAPSRRAPVAIAAAVALLAGGGIAYAMTRGPDAAAQAPTGSSTSSSTTSTTSSTSTSSSSTSSSPTTSEPTEDLSALQAAIDSCSARIETGAALVAVADAATDSWAKHVSGQTRLDEGEISYAFAEKLWAESKANGPAEVRAYDRAASRLAETDGDCDGVDTTTAESALAEDGKNCATAAGALARASSAAGTSVKQWEAHQAQMARKATTAGHAYHEMWLDFVSDAGPVIDGFRDAADEFAAAPACG